LFSIIDDKFISFWARIPPALARGGIACTLHLLS
ncbi:MAG: hypothetical protein ACI8UC_001468, partial [Psychromonas sp.]